MPPEDSQKINTNRYAVISPVRDEAEYIEATLQSMISQTARPQAWVIVDDGSTDGTARIVARYVEKYPWIWLVSRSDRGARQRGKGVIEAFYAGFAVLPGEYDFIVKLDGDLTFELDYFETLLGEFAADPRLGIAGGGVYEHPDGRNWMLYTTRDHVRGAVKMYRRECLQAIGGLAKAMGWDGIDEWKAQALGWKVQSFLEIPVRHYRFTGAATGYLKSCIEQGDGAYRMGYHPLFMIARGLRRMTDRPYVIGGLAMAAAYFWSALRRRERLADPLVVRYVRQTQLKKLAGLLAGRPVHE